MAINNENFIKHPAVEELVRELRYEFQNTQRPPEQVILDESDLCLFLKISKRHSANLRSSGAITYSKAGGKLYYKLSDVLAFIEKNQINSVDQSNRLFNHKTIKQ